MMEYLHTSGVVVRPGTARTGSWLKVPPDYGLLQLPVHRIGARDPRSLHSL